MSPTRWWHAVYTTSRDVAVTPLDGKCPRRTDEGCRMNRGPDHSMSADVLNAAGLAGDDVAEWTQAEPGAATEYASDRGRFSAYWQRSTRLLARLPPRARRS